MLQSTTETLVVLLAAVAALAYTVRKLSDAISKRNTASVANDKVVEFERAIGDLQEQNRILRGRVLRLEHRSGPHGGGPGGNLR